MRIKKYRKRGACNMSEWNKYNRKKPVGSRCGAKTRSGRPCQSFAMPNGRCRMHGGIVKPWKNKNQFQPGNKAAVKHGLYCSELSDEEIELLPYVKLGTLDEEIRMLKLKLRRAYIAQRMWLEQRERVEEQLERDFDAPPRRKRLARTKKDLEARHHLNISSLEVNKAIFYDRYGVPHTNVSKKVLRKKEDYSQEIRALSKLIGQLEIRRKDLLQQSQDSIKDLVQKFRDFSDAPLSTLPGGKMKIARR
jgi:hypothetical protein